MSSTFTRTKTQTSSITDAKYVASKIAADLETLRRRCGQSYPSYQKIRDFETEVMLMIKCGAWEEVQYGYMQANGSWVSRAALQYEFINGNLSNISDSSGGLESVKIGDAKFHSFAIRNGVLIPSDIQKKNPITRREGNEPSGNWGSSDRQYTRGSFGVLRSVSS